MLLPANTPMPLPAGVTTTFAPSATTPAPGTSAAAASPLPVPTANGPAPHATTMIPIQVATMAPPTQAMLSTMPMSLPTGLPALLGTTTQAVAGASIPGLASTTAQHADAMLLPLVPNPHPGAATVAELHPNPHSLSQQQQHGQAGASGLPVNENPTVSSPPDDDMDLPMDLIHSLNTMASGDLGLADDVAFKDDVWHHIFTAAANVPLPMHGEGAGAGTGAAGGLADGLGDGVGAVTLP